MNFNYYEQDNISIFRLDERKLDTSNSGLLKGEFASLITGSQTKKLIIDLQAIDHCDSSGLSALLVANKYIHENDGHLRLIPSEKIISLFKITKLDRILFLCSSIEEAMHELHKIEE